MEHYQGGEDRRRCSLHMITCLAILECTGGAGSGILMGVSNVGLHTAETMILSYTSNSTVGFTGIVCCQGPALRLCPEIGPFQVHQWSLLGQGMATVPVLWTESRGPWEGHRARRRRPECGQWLGQFSTLLVLLQCHRISVVFLAFCFHGLLIFFGA